MPFDKELQWHGLQHNPLYYELGTLLYNTSLAMVLTCTYNTKCHSCCTDLRIETDCWAQICGSKQIPGHRFADATGCWAHVPPVADLERVSLANKLSLNTPGLSWVRSRGTVALGLFVIVFGAAPVASLARMYSFPCWGCGTSKGLKPIVAKSTSLVASTMQCCPQGIICIATAITQCSVHQAMEVAGTECVQWLHIECDFYPTSLARLGSWM